LKIKKENKFNGCNVVWTGHFFNKLCARRLIASALHVISRQNRVACS